MTERQTTSYWLKGLHIALALSLPFILLLFLGCQKAKETKEDLGPEVDPSSIDLALSKAIGTPDLNNLAVGQFLEYLVTQRIENEETANAAAGSRVDVIKREESDSEVKFTLRIVRAQRAEGNEWERIVTEEPVSIKKPSLLGMIEPAITSRTLSAQNLAVSSFASRPVKRVSFHNLRESTGTLQAPARVRMRADCGGLNPCELQVRYIRFDLVQWYNDSEYQKVALDFAFSTQPPYLPFGTDFEQLSGLMVVDCRATYIPIEKRTVYVRECKTLEDFQK